MSAEARKRKKAKVFRDDCVACGACANVCPEGAIYIYKGIWADVDLNRCIGCSKCKAICPASAITMGIYE
jgi:ferredoxin